MHLLDRAGRVLRKTARNTFDRAKQQLLSSRYVQALPGMQLTYLLQVPKAVFVPELSLIYLPVTKVANRSIRAAIAAHIGLPYVGHPTSADWHTLGLAKVRRCNEYFRFAFVRNPLDRLLSCYSQKIVLYARQTGPPHQFWRYGSRFHAAMSFAEFVQEVAKIPDALSDEHFRSQHTFLVHRGELCCDHLARFETLQCDWQRLRERFGFGELPHENRSPHGPYRDEYTPELARLAAKRYAKDIDLFGYAEEVGVLCK